MKTEKYYTPELEEFHVGFEFEVKKGGGLIPEALYEEGQEWKTTVFQPGDYIFRINSGSIRVKYLDITDIQSLGWQLYEGPSKFFASFVMPRPDCKLTYDILNHHIFIQGRMGVLFVGTIKNISELRILMKQLGVEVKETKNENK